jgi:hypothetical protein
MAEHKVQLPDNSIITIEGPDDATDQELLDAANKHYATKQAKNTGPISTIKSAVESGAQSVRDSDAMAYGAGAAALAAGIPLAKKLKDRIFGEKEAPVRIDPEMDVNRQMPTEPFMEPEKVAPTTAAVNDWESQLSPQDRELLERSKANAAAKAATAPAPAPIPEPPAFILNQSPAGAAAPPVAIPEPIAPVPAPAPVVAPAVVEAPVATLADAVPPPPATPPATPPEKPAKKTGRPAASTLEPTTFRADLGPGDNWLYNTAGPERRRAILAEFNEGKPAQDYKTAQEIYKKYQDKYPKDMFGPVIPIEEAKSRGIKPPEPYGKLGKVAKVGGVAGLALTAAEMANAAQKSRSGNDAPLRETVFNLLGMIPGLGTAFTAGTFSGGLNENESAELARRRLMPPEITAR